MGEDMVQILIKAAKESKGETIDIVFEHELPGITQEMYEWWSQNMHETRLYKMWHPDHISFEIEKTNDPKRPFIAHPTEKIGKYGPSTMSFSGEPKENFVFKPKYKNYGCGVHIEEGIVLSHMYSEYEEGPNGLKLRAVHRWPAKVPKELVDALRKHINEEDTNFPKFLPALYAKEGKKASKK